MRKVFGYLLLAAAMAALFVACAPTAPAPTPIPTKAVTAPAAAPTKAATEAAKPEPAPTKAAAEATKPSAKPTGSPVKIGFVTALTGFGAPYGIQQKYGGVLAEEDINESGGINGRPLQLIFTDSPFDPKQAVTVIRSLAEKDRVFAVVGPYSSGEFEVAAPLANELQMPVIAPVALVPGVAGANRPWSFRLQLGHEVSLPVAVDAFKKQYPAIKRLLIIGDVRDTVSAVVVKDLLPKLLPQAGFEVIGTVDFTRGTTDFSPTVTKAKGMNADGIAFSGNPVDVANLVKEMDRQGFRLPTVGSAEFMGSNLPKLAGPSVEGWVAAGTFDPSSTDPAVQKFVAKVTARMAPDPGVVKPVWLAYEAQTYDSVTALAEIMRKAGITPDTPLQEARAKIRDGFQALKDYKGLVGSISMLPAGEATWKPIPFVVKGGGWVSVR